VHDDVAEGIADAIDGCWLRVDRQPIPYRQAKLYLRRKCEVRVTDGSFRDAQVLKEVDRVGLSTRLANENARVTRWVNEDGSEILLVQFVC
jgi:hypothetical protein